MIGIPIGQDRWWEKCTWPDGSPVHILTYEEIVAEECREIIDEIAEELRKRLEQTLNEILKENK